jgi:hypothetical protein
MEPFTKNFAEIVKRSMDKVKVVDKKLSVLKVKSKSQSIT